MASIFDNRKVAKPGSRFCPNCRNQTFAPESAPCNYCRFPAKESTTCSICNKLSSSFSSVQDICYQCFFGPRDQDDCRHGVHQFVDGLCDVCALEDPNPSNLKSLNGLCAKEGDRVLCGESGVLSKGSWYVLGPPSDTGLSSSIKEKPGQYIGRAFRVFEDVQYHH